MEKLSDRPPLRITWSLFYIFMHVINPSFHSICLSPSQQILLLSSCSPTFHINPLAIVRNRYLDLVDFPWQWQWTKSDGSAPRSVEGSKKHIWLWFCKEVNSVCYTSLCGHTSGTEWNMCPHLRFSCCINNFGQISSYMDSWALVGMLSDTPCKDVSGNLTICPIRVYFQWARSSFLGSLGQFEPSLGVWHGLWHFLYLLFLTEHDAP